MASGGLERFVLWLRAGFGHFQTISDGFGCLTTVPDCFRLFRGVQTVSSKTISDGLRINANTSAMSSTD